LDHDGRPAPIHRHRGAAPQGQDAGPILSELIAVLKPHARGLRRWSVMRALRDNRKRMSREIPHKFEDDVERIFRRFCADDVDPGMRACAAEKAPFYRPRETAGEVWALYPQRAEALLAGDPPESI
jgi:hypothetical protein